MMEIPEGADTVTIESSDLYKAISDAAKELGVKDGQVDHKLDLSHFRNTMGGSVPKRTVKIIAWNSGRSEDESPRRAPRPKPTNGARQEDRSERRSSRDRDDRPPRGRQDRPPRGRGDRSPRGSRDDRRGNRGDDHRHQDKPSVEDLNAEDEVAIWTVSWVEELLGLMDLQGEVKGAGDEKVVALEIDIKERAGRFIGRRGSTLSSIRHLLHVAIASRFDDRRLEITIPDSRSERPRSSDHDRADRRPSRQGGPEGPRLSEEKLQALAHRASEKAKETGQPVTIKVPLNSYDRRVIHMEIAQIEGVESQSVDRPQDDPEGNRKFLQIVPTTE